MEYIHVKGDGPLSEPNYLVKQLRNQPKETVFQAHITIEKFEEIFRLKLLNTVKNSIFPKTHFQLFIVDIRFMSSIPTPCHRKNKLMQTRCTIL